MKELEIVSSFLFKESKVYIKMLQNELEFQKHVAFGNLKNGFYAKVEVKGDDLVLQILNKESYMHVVNEGSDNGVKVDYADILEWTNQKERQGDLTFFNFEEKARFIIKVTTELKRKYLTDGGNAIAPRRYFFIQMVVAQIKDTNLDKQLEQVINQQISQSLGLDKTEDIITLNLA